MTSTPSRDNATATKHNMMQRFLARIDGFRGNAKKFASHAIDSHQDMAQQVLHDIDELKKSAQKYTMNQILSGEWFNQYVRIMLADYAQTITQNGGITSFHQKYPELTRDQIAQKVCDTAIHYATIAGGFSGAAISLAFASTIATIGISSVVAVPAGLAAIVAEMLYTTQLQVRLVYDLSVIYGHPIDVDNPSDVYKTFSLAYGITFASGNLGTAVKTFTPTVARTYIRGLVVGHTQAIRHVAMHALGPKIGSKITQKAFLSTAVPGVSIAVSSSWNYLSTRHIAAIANHELRAFGQLRDAVENVSAVLKVNQSYAPLVVECMLAVITADGTFDAHEQEVFNEIVLHLEVPVNVLEALEHQIDVTPESIEERLKNIDDTALQETLATCIKLVAVSDGTVHTTEIPILKRFLAALGHTFDLKEQEKQAAIFKCPHLWKEKAFQAVTETTTQVWQSVDGITRSLSTRLVKQKVDVEKQQIAAAKILLKGPAPVVAKPQDLEIEEVLERTSLQDEVVADAKAQRVVAAKTLMRDIAQQTEHLGDKAMQEVHRLTALHRTGNLSDEEFRARVEKLF